MKFTIKSPRERLSAVRRIERILSAQVIFIFLFFLGFVNTKTTLGFIREDRMNYTIIHCDHENLLWIGTRNGLYLWQAPARVRIQNTINIDISALCDFNNLLFIGSENGSLYCYNKTERYIKRIGKLSKKISALAWHNSTLYIGTNGDGIFQLNTSSLKKVKAIQSIGQERYIHDMKIHDGGNLWVASEKGLICHRYQSNIPTFQFEDEAVTCIHQQGNRFVFGTQSGNIMIGHLSKSNSPIIDTSFQFLYKINDILLTDRFVYIATKFGITKINGDGQVDLIGPENRSVEVIEIDLEGNIWAIGRHLLMQLRGEQIELTTNNLGNITSIGKTPSDELLLGSDIGLLKRRKQKKNTQMIHLLRSENNRNIFCQDGKDRTWITDKNNHLLLLNHGQFNKISLANNLPNLVINQIIEWSNKIWVATNYGAYSCSTDDSLLHFKEIFSSTGQKKMSVNQILEDNKKQIWFATEGDGIYKWDHDKLINLGNRLGIKSSIFESIAEDQLGHIWLSAFQNGLYCLQGDSVIHLTTDNGLASNNILSICAYKQKYLVAVSEIGIDLIEVPSLLTVHYNFEDLRLRCNPNTNAIIATKENDLYIGTQQGLLNYYLPKYRTLFAPEVFIDEIRANGQSINKKKNVFPPQTEFFRFIFRTRWNSEDEIFYRYKLIGLSDNWVTTAEKEITFAGLSSGKYSLLISASNNRKFVNEKQIQYDFIILSPFYRQVWFLILLVILVISIIVFIVRYREIRYSRLQILEKEMLMTEFQALKNQVSPHFLFNSFNTLIQVIDEDKNKGIEYTQMLSDFYRSLLSYRDKDTVEISEEFRVLNQYIYLQKMRFGDSLIYSNHCLADITPIGYIPPLTLQLLAENAVKHNQISAAKPLTLSLFIENDYLIIRNNINLKINNEVGEHIGLQNIKNRFRLLTKREVKIIHNDDNFEVRIPILNIK